MTEANTKSPEQRIDECMARLNEIEAGLIEIKKILDEDQITIDKLKDM